LCGDLSWRHARLRPTANSRAGRWPLRLNERRDARGRLSAAELERISTILFADREAPPVSQSLAQLSGLVHEIKPHFDLSVIQHQADWLRDLDLLESIA
jgi:hypothetical protein